MNSEDYKVPWLAKKLFHELPRLDLTFAPMNASFQPNLQSYREVIIAPDRGMAVHLSTYFRLCLSFSGARYLVNI